MNEARRRRARIQLKWLVSFTFSLYNYTDSCASHTFCHVERNIKEMFKFPKKCTIMFANTHTHSIKTFNPFLLIHVEVKAKVHSVSGKTFPSTIISSCENHGQKLKRKRWNGGRLVGWVQRTKKGKWKAKKKKRHMWVRKKDKDRASERENSKSGGQCKRAGLKTAGNGKKIKRQKV